MNLPRIFIGYSHADKIWRDRLAGHLKVLKEVAVWDDCQIKAGDDRYSEIKSALGSAAVVVMLISADFLTSEFIDRHEVRALLQRRAVRVIPLLVRPCAWSTVEWLAKLQIRPRNARALSRDKESRIDAALAALTLEIRELLVDTSTPAAVGMPRQPWVVPYERNPYFVGRAEILEQLRDRLTRNGWAVLGQTQAISGLGGIGKTQTVVEYAYRFRDDYQAVFFVPAATEAEILKGFGEIARRLGHGEDPDQDLVLAAVLQWLEENEGWLLIFDNADEPERVKPYMPPGHRGHVLLTSRARSFRGLGIRRPCRMPTLPPDEAVAFLLERSESETELGEEERQACEQLAKELGCLPLALEQAGAYLLEKGSRFQDYLAGYRRRGLELLGRGRPEGHQDPVGRTWALNFSEIEETSPASAELLRASAFLSPDEIPLEILARGAGQLGPILSEALAGCQDDPLVVDEILEPLTRYSLLSRNVGAGTYSVHRLVQQVLKRGMESRDQRVWAERILGALNEAFPKVQLSSWFLCDQLVPHVQVAAQWVPDESSELDGIGRLFHRTGFYLWHRARFAEAESFYRRSLEIKESVLNKYDPSIAKTLNNLGNIYRIQGRYDEAELLYRRSAEIKEKALGREHLDLAPALNNLGNLFYDQGRYEEAESLYHRSLEIKEKALGKDHPKVAQTLMNLGLLYRTQGRYERAEPLYHRSLEIQEKTLGKDHPEVARTLNVLGIHYNGQGRYEEAKLLCDRSLAIKEKALGKDHLEVARTLNNLGNLCLAQGRYKEAEPLFLRDLEITEKALGKDHPEVTQTLNNLGNLYRIQGRYEEAEQLLHHSLKIKEKVLGNNHPEVARTLNSVGLLCGDLGRYEEAESFFHRSLKIREKALGKVHLEVAQTLNNLGNLYRVQGHYEQAEPLFHRSLKIKEEVVGKDHPEVARTLNNLGILYSDQGRYEEAESLYYRSLEIKEKILGKDHPEVAQTVMNLGNLYTDHGCDEEAEPLFHRSLEILESTLGTQHPHSTQAVSNYVAFLRKTDREEEASELEARFGKSNSQCR